MRFDIALKLAGHIKNLNVSIIGSLSNLTYLLAETFCTNLQWYETSLKFLFYYFNFKLGLNYTNNVRTITCYSSHNII